ncbi:MAG: triose-phosphate isomerase [Roseivirga sp.]|nr:triose-phosphate isomerase [Roseivirga sp.]
MRKKIVAGNWKMNKTLDEGLALASEVANIANDEITDDAIAVLCTPFIHLSAVGKIVAGSNKVFLGAQNMSEHAGGAYTGDISADMLNSVGVNYVILGHSERREYHNESNAELASRVDAALANELTPIFCCGESLEVREAGTHVDFVSNQLKESLFHLDAEAFKKIVIAYEPIWAIGTGVTASSAQAQDMHKALRDGFAAQYGQDVADEISILYGGSAKPANAPELFSQPDIDGGLIGGASLKARDFVDIIKSY